MGERPNADILTAAPREGWTRPTGKEIDGLSVIEACHEAEERAVAAFEEAVQLLPEDWHWVLNEYSQHSIPRSPRCMRGWRERNPMWCENGAERGPHQIAGQVREPVDYRRYTDCSSVLGNTEK
jgi:hypothetical protein